jgi:transposase-like protein
LVDRGERETGEVTSSGSVSVFAGFRFPPEVISVAVRWYLRYGLSYRDVEELLAERAVTVDHVTIYRWVQRFTPEFIEAARPCRHAPGDRWFVDETYVKVAGKWAYLYLWVPITSSTSCDQPIFVDHATDVSLSSDAVQVEVDRLG